MNLEEAGIAGNNNDHPVTKCDRESTATADLSREKKFNGQRGDRTQDLRVISTTL